MAKTPRFRRDGKPPALTSNDLAEPIAAESALWHDYYEVLKHVRQARTSARFLARRGFLDVKPTDALLRKLIEIEHKVKEAGNG